MTSKTQTLGAGRTAAAAEGPGDPVAAARAEVERLADIERASAARRAELAAALAAKQKSAGEVALDATLGGKAGSTIAGQVDELRAIRDEISIVDSLVEAARRRRLVAIPAVWRAEAAVLRSRANALRAEADERAPKAADLLAALEAFEGCRYAPAAPNRPDLLHGGQVGGAMVVILNPITQTQDLREQAERLERQATVLEGREPVMAAAVEGPDVDTLVTLALADPMRISPPIAAIYGWAAEATEKVRERRRRLLATLGSGAEGVTPFDAPVFFRLEWRRGEIVAGESNAR